MVSMKCPICYSKVGLTRTRCLKVHFDKVGGICPASGEPKTITQQEKQQ